MEIRYVQTVMKFKFEFLTISYPKLFKLKGKKLIWCIILNTIKTGFTAILTFYVFIVEITLYILNRKAFVKDKLYAVPLYTI